MTKRNALILSKSESISKIVCSELALLGFTSKIIKEIPTSSDADIIVFDATSLELPASLRSFLNLSKSKKLAISNDNTEKLSIRFDKTFAFPFSISEFRSTVLDVMSLEASDITVSATVNEKCFVSDADKAGVFFGEIYIPLTVYEYKLLTLLCENSGNCVSKKDILALFDEGNSNMAEVYICHLRNKLEAPFAKKVIYTVRGKGYMTDHILI